MTTTTTTPASRPMTINWAALIWMGLMHLGALLALNPSYFSWSALLVCVVLHWVTGGLGICMTYHRLLTHRSFATRPKALEYVLTVIGCTASEGGAIGWVADHRKHHAHSDEEDDVHSPRRGFGWAHMFWWMTPDITSLHTPEYYDRWAKDLNRDPIHRILDKYHYAFPLALFGVLYWIGGMPWLVWGGFVRTILVLHTTWLVNSATHIWGYRNFETRDDSTNNWWVAIVTYGEGWHNNHHAFQTSARHGNKWYEFDMTYAAIRVMSLLGLAHSIKRPRMSTDSPTLKQPTLSQSPVPASSHEEDEQPELVGV